jgi:hypothetical protein
MPSTTNQTVTIGTTSALSMQRTIAAVETQNMTVAPSASQAWTWARTLLQKLTIHPADAEQLTYHAALAQVVHLTQLFTRGFPVTLTQAVTVQPSAALTLAIRLLQNLTVRMSQAPVGSLVLTLNQNVRLTPTQVLKAIYSGHLVENIAMSGLYISPSGTVTTWAINTRTNAVTEYTNYNFNSFAQRGLKYIAANSAGIYELDGDTDNGASINADVVSAFMQMNGSKLSGLKGIYLAIRGGGQYFIKVINGDGREYIYEALGQPGLMTTKVNVGKGLRARYVAFQLTSTGQDFDLDDLTFIPMLSDRRV